MIIDYPENPDAERMVRVQTKGRGITDIRVNEVMSRLPRHRFAGVKGSDAYGDFPISIGHGQTISQPYMVALMTEDMHLAGREKVLEVGTGSGYQTAVLAELAGSVYTIERIPALMQRARTLLISIGYKNIHFRIGDGSVGWEEQAPYDRILVAAAAASVPPHLKEQLADNGVLVIPVGNINSYQVLVIIRRIGSRFEERKSIGCRFVPLRSDQ